MTSIYYKHSFGLIIWIANYFLFKFWISGFPIFTIHNVVYAGLTYLGGAYLEVLLYTTSARMCGDLIYDDKIKIVLQKIDKKDLAPQVKPEIKH